LVIGIKTTNNHRHKENQQNIVNNFVK